MIALITRIVEGEGADRELDRQLALIGQYPNDGKMWFAPEFTSSVDAALAFAERMLPGWRISFHGNTHAASVDIHENVTPYLAAKRADAGPLSISLPRAILAATLKALEPK